MKTLFNSIVAGLRRAAPVCICSLLWFTPSSHAATVVFHLQAPFSTNLDTNDIVVTQVSTNVLANGQPVYVGLPLRLKAPTGYATNYLNQGWYSVVSKDPVVAPGSAFLIDVYDSGPAQYDMTNLLQSGFNTYAVTVFGSNPPPTLNSITNALGFLPIASAITNSAPTNGPLVSGQYTILVPTNYDFYGAWTNALYWALGASNANQSSISVVQSFATGISNNTVAATALASGVSNNVVTLNGFATNATSSLSNLVATAQLTGNTALAFAQGTSNNVTGEHAFAAGISNSTVILNTFATNATASLSNLVSTAQTTANGAISLASGVSNNVIGSTAFATGVSNSVVSLNTFTTNATVNLSNQLSTVTSSSSLGLAFAQGVSNNVTSEHAFSAGVSNSVISLNTFSTNATVNLSNQVATAQTTANNGILLTSGVSNTVVGVTQFASAISNLEYTLGLLSNTNKYVAGVNVTLTTNSGTVTIASLGGGGSATNAIAIVNGSGGGTTLTNSTLLGSVTATNLDARYDATGAATGATNGLPAGIWSLGNISGRASNDFYLNVNPSNYQSQAQVNTTVVGASNVLNTAISASNAVALAAAAARADSDIALSNAVVLVTAAARADSDIALSNAVALVTAAARADSDIALSNAVTLASALTAMGNTNAQVHLDLSNLVAQAQAANFYNTNAIVHAYGFTSLLVNADYFSVGTNIFLSPNGIYYFKDGSGNWDFALANSSVLYSKGGSVVGTGYTVVNGLSPGGATYLTNANWNGTFSGTFSGSIPYANVGGINLTNTLSFNGPGISTGYNLLDDPSGLLFSEQGGGYNINSIRTNGDFYSSVFGVMLPAIDSRGATNTGIVQFSNSANQLHGSFFGDGSGVTNTQAGSFNAGALSTITANAQAVVSRTNELWVASWGSDTNSGFQLGKPLGTLTNAVAVANSLSGQSLIHVSGYFSLNTFQTAAGSARIRVDLKNVTLDGGYPFAFNRTLAGIQGDAITNSMLQGNYGCVSLDTNSGFCLGDNSVLRNMVIFKNGSGGQYAISPICSTVVSESGDANYPSYLTQTMTNCLLDNCVILGFAGRTVVFNAISNSMQVVVRNCYISAGAAGQDIAWGSSGNPLTVINPGSYLEVDNTVLTDSGLVTNGASGFLPSVAWNGCGTFTMSGGYVNRVFGTQNTNTDVIFNFANSSTNQCVANIAPDLITGDSNRNDIAISSLSSNITINAFSGSFNWRYTSAGDASTCFINFPSIAAQNLAGVIPATVASSSGLMSTNHNFPSLTILGNNVGSATILTNYSLDGYHFVVQIIAGGGTWVFNSNFCLITWPTNLVAPMAPILTPVTGVSPVSDAIQPGQTQVHVYNPTTTNCTLSTGNALTGIGASGTNCFLINLEVP